jgi:hypothetical protein
MNVRIKKKTLIALAFIAFFIVLPNVVSLGHVSESEYAKTELVSTKISEAKIKIPIQIGTRGCVCKAGRCMDQNWVSFRPYCGHQGNGGGSGSDAACAIVDNGNCD